MTESEAVSVDETAPEGAVGHRVAVQRKLAGLTQQQLATRAHVSKSLVCQVEQGTVPASAAFTAAVARVLGLEVDVLTGEPYGPPITDLRAEHAGIPALRAALDSDEDPDFEGLPMPVAMLRARLDRYQAQSDNARYASVVAALPELLNHCYAVAARAGSGHDAQQAGMLLVDGYELAQLVSHRFGYLDLAALAARCGRDAAGRVGDPQRTAVAAVRFTDLRLRRGDHSGVLRLLDRAHRLIEDDRCPTAHAVRTHLHLRQALTHARSGSPDQAEEHLDVARQLLAPGVPQRPYHGVWASAAIVDLHSVATAVELSDPTTALNRAQRVRLPDHTPPCHAAEHWITVARAWTLHGDRANALAALHQARRIAPQLTRYHPDVHQTVHLLAEHTPRATDTLAGFTRWLGVPR